MSKSSGIEKAKLHVFEFVLNNIGNSLNMNDLYSCYNDCSQEILDTVPTKLFIPLCRQQIQDIKELGAEKVWDDLTGKTEMDRAENAFREAGKELFLDGAFGQKAKEIAKKIDKTNFVFSKAEGEYENRMRKPGYKNIDRILKERRRTSILKTSLIT